MWIASCTKLMTCVAVLQCVERGTLDLDEDVTKILPELKDLKILTGFDEESGEPITKKRSKTITLKLVASGRVKWLWCTDTKNDRHLLTHSSGMGYDFVNPILQKWRASQGQTISRGKTIASRFDCPLLFEPGTAWSYSPSIDWAGKMVERVCDDVSLQDYMKTYIWGPLGINDMVFHLRGRPDLEERIADLSIRHPNGDGTVSYVDDIMGFKRDVDDAMGGGGVFGTAPEYMKVLQSILADDGVLLKSASINELFKPQLSTESQQSLMKLTEDPVINIQARGVPLGTMKNWSLGGILIQEDLPGWWRKNTLGWGGLPNLTWVSVLDQSTGTTTDTKPSLSTAKLVFVGCMLLNSFQMETRNRSN